MFGLSEKDRKLLSDLRKVLGTQDGTATGYAEEIVRLKKQIVDLEIKEAKLKEAHDREDRELRHMIGLEKKRQEFEIDAAKRTTELTVREENLAADRKRFEEQLKFHEDRFSKEVGYLKDILGDILKRLPNVNVEAKR